MQAKAIIAQRLSKALCQNACQGQGRGTACVGAKFGKEGCCHRVDVHFKGQIHGKGGHQNASGNMTWANGGDEGRQEEH